VAGVVLSKKKLQVNNNLLYSSQRKGQDQKLNSEKDAPG